MGAAVSDAGVRPSQSDPFRPRDAGDSGIPRMANSRLRRKAWIWSATVGSRLGAACSPPALRPRELFSTITGLPQLWLSCSATRRASASVVEPAGEGTTMVTRLAGKLSCAWARGVFAVIARNKAKRSVFAGGRLRRVSTRRMGMALSRQKGGRPWPRHPWLSVFSVSRWRW